MTPDGVARTRAPGSPQRRGRRLGLHVAVAAMLVAALTGAAAPGASPGTASTPRIGVVRPIPSAAATAGPQPGGTLRVVVPSGGLEHLDPALADTPAERELLEVTGRQLVGYLSSVSLAARQDPAADVTLFPDPSDDKLSYSFRLRDVHWPAPVSRVVRAADVVYAIKRLCWPGHLSPGLALFERDVAGLTAFCAGLAAAVPDGAPEAVRGYDDTHDISGVQAHDSTMVTIAVRHPVGDFLNTLALPYAMPVPEEAVGDDLPDSAGFRAHMPALGPYAITAAAGDGALVLTRNAAWEPDTDPLRRAYPDRIEIQSVADAAAAARAVLDGTADLVLGGLPAATVAAALPGAAGDPRVRATAAASLTYLEGMSTTGACGEALADARVRSALGLQLDRGALAAAQGGQLLSRPADGLLPPGVLGSASALGAVPAAAASPVPADPFATPGQGGDPAAARALLAAALPAVTPAAPLPCTLAVQATGLGPLAAALVAQLAPLGVHVSLVRGRADLVLRTFTAPWRGNAARTLLTALAARCATAGCYAAPEAGANPAGLTGPPAAAAEVTAAEASADQNLAEPEWEQAAALVLATTPVVPLVTGRTLSLAGPRVTTFRWADLAGDADLGTVALSTG